MKKTRNTVALTDADLKLISNICHDYKDGHRGDKSSLLPVMALEKKIAEQTGGAYRADPAYDYSPPATFLGATLDKERTEKSGFFTVYKDGTKGAPLYVLETGMWYTEAGYDRLIKIYQE